MASIFVVDSSEEQKTNKRKRGILEWSAFLHNKIQLNINFAVRCTNSLIALKKTNSPNARRHKGHIWRPECERRRKTRLCDATEIEEHRSLWKERVHFLSSMCTCSEFVSEQVQQRCQHVNAAFDMAWTIEQKNPHNVKRERERKEWVSRRREMRTNVKLKIYARIRNRIEIEPCCRRLTGLPSFIRVRR